MSLKSTSKDFEVLNKLGQGSFGTVYKVRRKADKNFYVMKSINISQMDRRGQQESVNEVKILASLDSPYIVKYFDSFIENKTLNIIMEFCDKGDLSQAIRSQMGRLIIESKIWKYFIQMCLGLEFIHSKRILHRDIKSMNVFLIRDDCVRIGDLGVAKVLANTAAFAHTMVGTPYYLSPELCEEKPYNVKSDVWALGCVLYELCTLKHPFDALNQGALLLKIIKGSYATISSSYSNELREVVDLCLCKDYRKRPNIPGILNRPLIKEKAIGMNICIPETSVLAGIGIGVPREPALIYQSQMAIIEEEKVGQKGKVSVSPVSARGPVGKKDVKAPEKPSHVREPVVTKVEKAKVPVKIPEKVLEKAPEAEKKIINVYMDLKNIQYKPLKPTEKDPAEVQKAKILPEPVSHYKNIQFDPPQNLENKIIDQKPKSNAIRVSPKNMAQKLEQKLNQKNEALKLAANKAVIKPTPRPEVKQKVIKPGIQAPHFMPPQRPSDIKPIKKDPDPIKISAEMKQVQDLPDYPKSKKASISQGRPLVVIIQVKKFEMLIKPIIEDTLVIDPFTETIDWNLTQTGFPSKSFIPVAGHDREEIQEFQVNYAKSIGLEEDTDENDDELYQVSDSDNEEEESTNNEFNEDYENENENPHDRLEKAKKELLEAERMITLRTQEIINRVGQKTFQEMYFFFKEKASVIHN